MPTKILATPESRLFVAEALCPDCAEFITGPLTQLFQNGLSTITTLTIIPYGNAKLIGGSIRCQVGKV